MDECLNASQHKLGVALVTVVFLLWDVLSFAQELEPRSYVNAPIGMNFLVLGYGFTDGDVAPSPSAPIENAHLTMNAVALGYARTFELLGSSAKFDVQTFRGCYDGEADISGEPQSVSRCEWGDARARISWNFIGAPAMTPEEYRANFKPGFTMGASLQVEVPTGDYQSNRLVNAGTNRWMLRPGIGMSYIWEGWFVDASMEVKFFEDNDNYLGTVVSQDPMVQFQTHVVRYFMPGGWIALDVNYYKGGESSRNAFELDDGLDNARMGMTVSFPLAKQHSLRLNASTGVLTRVGSDFDSFGAAYQYRF